MNKMQEIIEYEKEFAEKLVKNISLIADIRNIKVKSQTSNSMSEINLHEWYTWLYKRLEIGIGYELEEDFIKIIDRINSRNNIIKDEMEHALVNVLSCVDKLEAMVKDRDKQIIELKNKLQQSNLLKYIPQGDMENSTTNTEENNNSENNTEKENTNNTEESTSKPDKEIKSKKKKSGGMGTVF